MGENRSLLPKVLSIFDRIRNKFEKFGEGKRSKFLLDTRTYYKKIFAN